MRLTRRKPKFGYLASKDRIEKGLGKVKLYRIAGIIGQATMQDDLYESKILVSRIGGVVVKVHYVAVRYKDWAIACGQKES